MSLILTVIAVFAVLCLSELGWRKHWFANEFGRKFVHIVVGSFVAVWPFYLSWSEIRLLSVAFLVVVFISTRLKIFNAIHSVQRPTFGELCFAAVVGLLTYVTESKAVYAAAILQMSLADGMAAVIGTRYGRDNKYHLLGHIKSVAGTGTFIVISVLIFIGFNIWGPGDLGWPVITALAVGAAFLENVSPLGLDNLIVPLFVGIVLNNL
jgi:phytol kinase